MLFHTLHAALLAGAALALELPVSEPPSGTSEIVASYYYDVANMSACNEALYPGWSDNTNVGPPACEQYPNVDTLASLNTSRIVAIRASVFDNITREEICGREVRIYDASGNQVMLDEGAFYVWDRCSGCDSIPEHNYETRIDLSTKAYLQITGESCRNPAHGLRYEILPNKVRSWPWDGNPERN